LTIITSRVEFERLERGAIRFLSARLNAQIAAEEAEWAAEDADFANAMGRDLFPVTLEEIGAENFYAGHQPTLIEAPIDRYPNVTAMAFRADNVNDNNDHMDKFMISLAVEIMVKAIGPTDRNDTAGNAAAAELCNSRIKRTAAAAHKVLMSDDARSFGQIVPRIGNTPSIFTTDVFVRHEDRGHGPRWFWQGARLDYRVEQWVSFYS
jgi:hypothetical protein